jgi:hypothetical protein
MPCGTARRVAPPVPVRIQSAFASPSVFRQGLGGILIGMGVCIGMNVCHRRFWASLFPKPFGNYQGIDLEALPPGQFIAGLMQLPMMPAAERDGESSVGVNTIRRAEVAEDRTSLTAANELAIRRALENVGVEFIPENGGGPGVRLPKRQRPK